MHWVRWKIAPSKSQSLKQARLSRWSVSEHCGSSYTSVETSAIVRSQFHHDRGQVAEPGCRRCDRMIEAMYLTRATTFWQSANDSTDSPPAHRAARNTVHMLSWDSHVLARDCRPGRTQRAGARGQVMMIQQTLRGDFAAPGRCVVHLR